MRNFALLASFLCVALLTASCSTPKKEIVGKPPPKTEETQPRHRTSRIHVPGEKRAIKRKDEHPDPIFAAPLWPYVEEGKTFTLHWAAGEEWIPVFAEPDLDAPVRGEASFEKNERVNWEDTYVTVYEPSVYRAKKQVELEGFIHDPGDFRTGGEAFTTTVNPGDSVAVLHYAGGGLCYMKLGNEVVQAPCPTPDNFSGNFQGKIVAEKMQPAARVWWVRIATPQLSGWLPVDDRFAVDLESL